ncbi:hypothetical protein [Moraxella lacunata]|uniref:hypothetical protein n=1 Tax=Moraxella lacunata TaxID=477 RepID=UPI003EE03C2E
MAVFGGLKGGVKPAKFAVGNHADIAPDDITSVCTDQKWRAILGNRPKQSFDTRVKKHGVGSD